MADNTKHSIYIYSAIYPSSHQISQGSEVDNLRRDYCLISTQEPVIPPPNLKSSYISLGGGANGSIDCTTSIWGYPTYENRSGNFDFIFDQEGLYKKYDSLETYTKNGVTYKYIHGDPERFPIGSIEDYKLKLIQTLYYRYHGQKVVLNLSDESRFNYKGRVTISGWAPGENSSTISMAYSLEPFKYDKFKQWLDVTENPYPNNFVDHKISDIPTWYNNYNYNTAINIPLRSALDSNDKPIVTNVGHKIGDEGVVPMFVCDAYNTSDDDLKGIIIQYTNENLRISSRRVELDFKESSDGQYFYAKSHDIILTKHNSSTGCRLVRGDSKSKSITMLFDRVYL